MVKKIDLDEFKHKYIGQIFGWLTVIDVYKDSIKGRYFFKCKCKCGNEVCKPYDKVISGHTCSCGCYKHSKEYSNSLHEYWKTNPDKVASKTEKTVQWCKDNPDKVAERGKKHSQFYKDHPEVVTSQIEKRKQTFENDSNIQEHINEKLRLFWDDEKKAKFSEERKQYYNEHPEICESISESLLKYYEDHPEKKDEISKYNKEWCRQNYNKVLEQGKNHSNILKNRRLVYINNVNQDEFLDVLHPSQIDDFLNGNIKGSDEVLVKCSVCGRYESRTFNNVWRVSSGKFKNKCKPICSSCINHTYTSSYENEISDYISTFYNGELIKNSREIISPFELDLYYPEKKIAIEFNGDYWHSEEFKDKDYHYNKFKRCYDLGITLVSVFEQDWCNSKESILSYIKDLFNGINNNISFIDESTINLNYPLPNLNLSEYNNFTTNCYISRGSKIYTCGYADMLPVYNDLQFLIELADEYNLEHFINDHGDLEIKDKNLCFHLADMLSAELDSFDRWRQYNVKGIRCVFVYLPDLLNQNKVNIYKNILIYHCGFSKRIYARNTVVKKYPAIRMKQFFNENNIAGYRNARTAYVLEDKKTNEPLMCYLIGHSYFGKGNYDCEIARGACKLGVCVTGGASKLWKHIISDNPDVKSIVYYVDRRQYDQRSISHLMDSSSMQDLGSIYHFNGGKSFMNLWLADTFIGDKLWHTAGDFANREPAKHKLVMDAIHSGKCISVYNPGAFVNVFVKKGYHLDGLKVVND